MGGSETSDADAYVQRWVVTRRAAVALMIGPFLVTPLVFFAWFRLSDGPPSPFWFSAVGIGSLALVPLGWALLALAQHRLFRAALADTSVVPVDVTRAPVSLTGGACSEIVRVTWPLARLTVGPTRISLRILGREHFACARDELLSIRPRRGFLSSELVFATRARRATFAPVHPFALVRSLRAADWTIAAE